jgi:hypothetical protein
MSCGLVDLHQSSISKHLEVNATSIIMMIIWENLIVELMKVSSQDMQQTVKGTNALTKECINW